MISPSEEACGRTADCTEPYCSPHAISDIIDRFPAASMFLHLRHLPSCGQRRTFVTLAGSFGNTCREDMEGLYLSSRRRSVRSCVITPLSTLRQYGVALTTERPVHNKKRGLIRSALAIAPVRNHQSNCQVVGCAPPAGTSCWRGSSVSGRHPLRHSMKNIAAKMTASTRIPTPTTSTPCPTLPQP